MISLDLQRAPEESIVKRGRGPHTFMEKVYGDLAL